MWDESRGLDIDAAFQDLPACLRFDIALHLVNDTVRKVPIFDGTDKAFVRSVIKVLKPIIAVQNEEIVQAGTFCNTIYLVHWGQLEVCHPKRPLGTCYSTAMSANVCV